MLSPSGSYVPVGVSDVPMTIRLCGCETVRKRCVSEAHLFFFFLALSVSGLAFPWIIAQP
jgi:hypothetical protein